MLVCIQDIVLPENRVVFQFHQFNIVVVVTTVQHRWQSHIIFQYQFDSANY